MLSEKDINRAGDIIIAATNSREGRAIRANPECPEVALAQAMALLISRGEDPNPTRIASAFLVGFTLRGMLENEEITL